MRSTHRIGFGHNDRVQGWLGTVLGEEFLALVQALFAKHVLKGEGVEAFAVLEVLEAAIDREECEASPGGVDENVAALPGAYEARSSSRGR